MIQGLKPDFVAAFVLADIAIILVAARLVGGLALRVGQPRVVGEIVSGVLLGPSVLGPFWFTWGNAPSFLHCDASRAALAVGADPAMAGIPPPSITQCLFPTQARGVLSILGSIALIFFMVLVGAELNLSGLATRLKGVLAVALGVVAAPLVGGLAIGPLLHDPKFALPGADGMLPDRLGFSLFVAALLAVTAFPVMARILQEKNLITSDLGVVGVSAAALVTVAMFLLTALARGVASEASTGSLAKVFVGTALYLLAMAIPVRLLLGRTIGGAIEARGAITGTELAVVGVVALGSAYAADRIGIHVIVGGFVAGAVLPARGIIHRELAARLADITNVILLPIFLAFSGLRTDFTTLRGQHIVGLVLVLVVGILTKWAAGAAAARIGGLSWNEGLVLGALMNCRGLLVLVVGILAVDSGIFTPQMQLAGVVMALVTTAMTGPLVDRSVAAVGTPAPDPARVGAA
ncbi:MAG: cation:proton antiporter [Acidimicrobiia bacterium]|nr:cation:proton antiporter [Acidimicrobiia bacterium]